MDVRGAPTRLLSPGLKQRLRRLLYVADRVVGGGQLRERALLALLGHHYASKFRREWQWSEEPPHFYDQRIGIFEFATGERGRGPYPFYRGFFASEVIRPGDSLLDIGCGDGFFTRRFFSERCGHIDALDVEPSAIEAATARNRAANITYHLLDGIAQPFPRESYDVIVLDGALGHLPPDTTARLLEKISRSLAAQGVFVGSESLGIEGSDHLQFFHSLEDLHTIMRPKFKHVEFRSTTYRIGVKGESTREEAYWRCANSPERMSETRWRQFGTDGDVL
jgi:SAM-dependent methyltransferase